MEQVRLWHVTSFYHFVALPLDGLEAMRESCQSWMSSGSLRGLVLLAPEGINGTVAGSASEIYRFKSLVQSLIGVENLRFKDSQSVEPPFKRTTVDVRDEIVGLKRTDLVPSTTENCHLTAREWHEKMSDPTPKIVIDTRNRYETSLGKFRDAIEPDLTSFSDWPSYVAQSNLDRETPVMLYCTGGIRCEKAILEMRNQGFEKVYQLRDGILGYLKEYPDGYYDGDCFVFDDRVSLGPDLQPTGAFGICPGCGLTSGEKRSCEWCGIAYFVCPGCEATWAPVCSKTCRDRWRRHGKPISR